MRVRVRADYKARITDGRWHQGIHALEEYFVLDVYREGYRMVDDEGEPIIYPKALFEVLDHTLPPGWEFREYEEGDYYLQPIRTARPGFYEDFFFSNGDRAAEAETQRIVREVLETCMTTGSDEDRRLIERDLRRLRGPAKPRER